MPNDEDDFDFDDVDDDVELPTTDSPSGLRPLNTYGHELLARILPSATESVHGWARRLRENVPQVRFGPAITSPLRREIEAKLGQTIPEPLDAIWAAAPGIFLDHDSFLWSPANFLKENCFYEDHMPEIFGTMVFFGGFDGFNGAVALDDTDPTAYYWSHEEGFTGQKCPDIASYVAEHIAWYATTFQPFCFKHGYVPKS